MRMLAPPSDYEAKRIGPNPPASLATLRSQSGAQVLAACGVPIELFEGSSGTGQREAWRRFLHGSVSPLGDEEKPCGGVGGVELTRGVPLPYV